MFKLYGRKSSFKKDKKSGEILINQIKSRDIKNFLEIGVYQGVTARNVCEILNKSDENFNYYGIDLFEDSNEIVDKKEFTLKANKLFSNPFKNIWFKYILRENPHSEKSVRRFLKKFEKNVKLLKGYSNVTLANIPINTIDFAFIDGGHSYETCKYDIGFCINGMKKKSIIICDDYNITGYGVRKAVDEIQNLVESVNILNDRFAMIVV
jgi:predicted O-methyltransferase YrrM